MKKLIFSSFLVIIFAVVIIVITSGKNPKELISPILSDEKVLGVNQWLPQQVFGSLTNAPQISAEAGFFIDTKSGQILYSKNQDLRLPIASLVKVMTVLIALEHKNMDDKFTVSKSAADMEPDKMSLIAGEKLTLKELLSGIFLVSGNDAAETLAERSTGSRSEFIKLMNDQAKQLGMVNTFYANPTGLDEDSNNSYSSAYDLALLTRYLIRHYPEVVDISKQEHIYISQTEDHQDYDLSTGINLIATYPGVVGLKIGYTQQAGLTLITLARKDGHEIAGILLNSEDRRDEARELLEYSFNKLKK